MYCASSLSQSNHWPHWLFFPSASYGSGKPEQSDEIIIVLNYHMEPFHEWDVKEIKKSEVTYSQVWRPILRIHALHFTHPSAHTQQWTHTQWTHTRSSGQPFMLRRPRSNWGSVLCSRAPRRGIKGGERTVHSLPHLQSLPARDSNSQPFNYESYSLPLGHDFPGRVYILSKNLHMQRWTFRFAAIRND